MSAIIAVAVGGVFDGLHLGHIKLLEFASRLASIEGVPLKVLINSDKSLTDLNRQAQHDQAQREELVLSIIAGGPANPVQVILFDETTPNRALAVEAEDGMVIFVKGKDTIQGRTTPPELHVPGVLFYYHEQVNGKVGYKLASRTP